MLNIALGSDHGGFELKDAIKQFLTVSYPDAHILDFGTHDAASVHYPDFARKVCKSILSSEANVGILVCGTGIGISMMANRFKGIRAALVYDLFTAEMAKVHNNANVLCLGGRTTSVETAKKIIAKWLDSEFEGGRHASRIQMLDDGPFA